jgi:hypothetical protein
MRPVVCVLRVCGHGKRGETGVGEPRRLGVFAARCFRRAGIAAAQGCRGVSRLVNACRGSGSHPACARVCALARAFARGQQEICQRLSRNVSGVTRAARVAPGWAPLPRGVRSFMRPSPERHAWPRNSRDVRWLFAGGWWTESRSGVGLCPGRLKGRALGGWWTESGMVTCRWVDWNVQN